MKYSAQHDETAHESDANHRRRRFRLGRRALDSELEQVDQMVEQVDRLTAPEAADGPAVADPGDPTTEAARAALLDLERRLAVQPVQATSDSPTPPAYEPGAANSWHPTQDATYQTQEPTVSTSTTSGIDPLELQSRIEASLSPTPTPVFHTDQAPVAEMRPTVPTRRPAMLVDVNRIIQSLEEEADSARQRIDIELRNARDEADVILREANNDADRIREHAQSQARVLLGEVEEIISEAQHTGQEILRRAESDSDSVREQALLTLEQAQDEARTIVDTARREGESILSEQRRLATVRAQEALREQDRLKDQIRRLEERRRQVLESLEAQIAQLSQMIPGASSGQRNVVEFPGGHSMGS